MKLLLNISDFKNGRVTNNNKSFQSYETVSPLIYGEQELIE